MERCLVVWGLSLLCLLGGTVGLCHADVAGQPSEEQLKIAYIYNFTKFVSWPLEAFSDRFAPFRLCVLGNDPFGSLLDTLGNRMVQGRTMAIQRIGWGGQTTGCHVLYITPGENELLPPLWQSLHGKPVLTIGDQPGFVQSGGMINFIRLKDTLRFEIHQETLVKSGLKVSAAMLQVGIVIQ